MSGLLSSGVLDAMRNHLANALRTLGTTAGMRIDWAASEDWELAALDFIVDTVTGKSVGQWAERGANALAEHVQTKAKAGEDVGNWADRILSVAARPLVRSYAKEIFTAFSPVPWPELLEEAPQDPKLFVEWARANAKKMGIKLIDFLAARSRLSPNRTDNW